MRDNKQKNEIKIVIPIHLLLRCWGAVLTKTWLLCFCRSYHYRWRNDHNADNKNAETQQKQTKNQTKKQTKTETHNYMQNMNKQKMKTI